MLCDPRRWPFIQERRDALPGRVSGTRFREQAPSPATLAAQHLRHVAAASIEESYVAVLGIPIVQNASTPERVDDLLDPILQRPARRETEHATDLVELHSVVPLVRLVARLD